MPEPFDFNAGQPAPAAGGFDFNAGQAAPSIGQQAESFFGGVGAGASLHLAPMVTGAIHGGIDAVQDWAGPGMVSSALGGLQGLALGYTGNPNAEEQMQGQGANAYEQALRAYHQKLQQQAPSASMAGEFTGAVVGGAAMPASRAGGITGLARNAAIDAGLAGVDMYGQTGDIGQVPSAALTGAGFSAGFGAAGKAIGATARGVGKVASTVGDFARATKPVADVGARILDAGADVARRTDPMQLRQQMHGGVDTFFDELANPQAVERRANEANAAQAGMRQVSMRNQVNKLPGAIESYEAASPRMPTRQAGQAGQVQPIRSLEDAEQAFGPGQLELLDESLYNRRPDRGLSPQMLQAYEDLAPVLQDRGISISFSNIGVGADASGRLHVLDWGDLKKGGGPPPLPIRSTPEDLALPEPVPHVRRGTPGVQGFGQDVERLGLLQPSLGATQRKAKQVEEAAGALRGDIVRQSDDIPVDASSVAQMLNQRADEYGRLLNQSGIAGRLRIAANEVSGRADDLKASELWHSIRKNRKNVNRNSDPDTVNFYGEIEKIYDRALDQHVWGYGGDQAFQIWKQAGRDYQVALQTTEMVTKLMESGAANRFMSLSDMLAMGGGMAAGGPAGFAAGAVMAGANKLIRANEKPWEGAFYRHVRDLQRSKDPGLANQIAQARQTTHGLADVAGQIPGMLGTAASAGAIGLRGAGQAANVVGMGLQAAGGATSSFGRGVERAAPVAGRVAGLEQEPMQPATSAYQGPVYDYVRQQNAQNAQTQMADRVRRAVVGGSLPAGTEQLQRLVQEGASPNRLAAMIQELQQTNPAFASWLRSQTGE